MRRSIRLQTSALFLVGLLFSSALTPAYASQYKVGAGDQLFVDFPLRGIPSDLQSLAGNGLTLIIVGESVFFRYRATVAPDGFITLPSMAPFRVDGMTLEQVRDEVASHLKTISLRDQISVILDQPNSQAFTVTGEVNKPGRFVYAQPTTLMEALAMAGGPTDHAKLKKILLFQSGQPMQSFDLSYKNLMKNGAPTIALHPSDTVIVPRRWYTPEGYLILIALSIVTTGAAVYVASK